MIINTDSDTSTQEKIKQAARLVFTRKGYAATKVRDIASQTNTNVSLVNYYFRSKEKLFEIIMEETIQTLFEKIQHIVNNESLPITEKIEYITARYIDLLIENPDFPLFIVNEVMSGSSKLPQLTNNGKMFLNSHFAKQLMALQEDSKIQYHPFNIMINLIGMLVFPFIARPLLLRSGALQEEEFKKLIQERKRLIPIWINQLINS